MGNSKARADGQVWGAKRCSVEVGMADTPSERQGVSPKARHSTSTAAPAGRGRVCTVKSCRALRKGMPKLTTPVSSQPASSQWAEDTHTLVSSVVRVDPRSLWGGERG